MSKASSLFGAAKKAAKDQEASYKRRTPMVFVYDGERVPFRVNDMADELTYVHSIKYFDKEGGERFETAFCGMEANGECEGCDRAASGDARVGNRSPNGALSVVDLRWFGRNESDKKDQEGNPYVYYNAIPVDLADPFEAAPKNVTVPPYKKGEPPRKYLRENIVRQPNSQLLLLSNKWTNLLGAEVTLLGSKCAVCGKGKISIEGYKVGSKGKVVAEDPGGGDPIYSCTKCSEDDEPKPYDIIESSVPLYVSRTGKSMKTTYAFSVDKSQDMEMMEWAEKYKPVDLDEACAPTGAGRYETLLKGGKGGKDKAGKEEKEVEDDEEDAGDDDDDSLYNKSSKKKVSVAEDSAPEKPKMKLKLKSKKG